MGTNKLNYVSLNCSFLIQSFFSKNLHLTANSAFQVQSLLTCVAEGGILADGTVFRLPDAMRILKMSPRSKETVTVSCNVNLCVQHGLAERQKSPGPGIGRERLTQVWSPAVEGLPWATRCVFKAEKGPSTGRRSTAGRRAGLQRPHPPPLRVHPSTLQAES